MGTAQNVKTQLILTEGIGPRGARGHKRNFSAHGGTKIK